MTIEIDTTIAATRRGSRPPAVLQILPGLVNGGVERGTVEIAQALAAAGWKAVVASSGGPMVREIERAGGKHVTLPLASKNPLVMRSNIGRLTDLIRSETIDIVHARSRAPAWSAVAATEATGCHFVTTFHNVYGAESRLKRYYNSVMARGERVIAISEFVGAHAAETYGVGPDRLRIIPRGVDLARFDPERIGAQRMVALSGEWQLPDGVPVVMLPGRFSRWKGHLVLLDALALLGNTELRCMLVGAGDEGYRDEVITYAKKSAPGVVVQIADTCRDMPAAYMLADVVVSPATRPEGFGRVIVEAQAMGRPVVATDHGGARETIIPGETGWLVPPGDAETLAQAIGQALALSPEARFAHAARATSHIRTHFDTKSMAARTIGVYEEILFPVAAHSAVANPA